MDLPDLRIAPIAESQHGVFSRAQALAGGLSRWQVDGRLDRGQWLGLHRGVYRLRGVPSSFEGPVPAAVLAAGQTACASHRTAAVLWKLEGIVADSVQISIRDRERTRVPGVVVHLPRTLRVRDVTRIGAIRVTTPARTLLDLAGAVGAHALDISLVWRRLTSLEKVRQHQTRSS